MVAVQTCQVRLWGRIIGATYWDPHHALAAFEYEPAFQASGIQVAPLKMPLSARVFRFPALVNTPFGGVPGLLADSLLDGFSRAALEQWCVRERRIELSPVEHLCYIGNRGMGALEFRPAIRNTTRGSAALDVRLLTDLAQHVLDLRDGLKIRLRACEYDYARALDDVLRVGTSARGARAKAVVAWNPVTGELRSGQARAPEGFEYWLLKFDAVSHRPMQRSSKPCYGRIEYAHALMAAAANIDVPACRLLHVDDRSHFMIQRFDRHGGDKLHMQSLFGLRHMGEHAGTYGYHHAFEVLESLALAENAFRELFRRMTFNVLVHNIDFHAKKIAFLMNKAGQWSLAPAFDLVAAYDPSSAKGTGHSMTINGRRDDITRHDLLEVARRFRVPDAEEILMEATDIVARWPEYAEAAGVPDDASARVAAVHRALQH